MADLPHLRITDTDTSYDYTARGGGGGGEFQRPPRDRAAHAAKLQGELTTASQVATDRGFQTLDPIPLTYELQPHALKIVQSLEDQRSGIELLSVVQRQDRIIATVRVPADKQRIIRGVLTRYATELDRRSQRPKRQDLIENIDLIRLATESDLWTDSTEFPAVDAPIWWEVWLYHNNDNNDQADHGFRR